MLKKLTPAVLFVFFFSSLASCASLGNGSKQKIPISANAAGAEVTIDGQTHPSPAVFILDRSHPYYLVSIKKGFESREIYLRRGINGWVFGNIVFGGTLGFVVDIATGAIYKFQPTKFDVNLAQAQTDVLSLEGKDAILVKVKVD